jgi:Tfp pilus assembly protein PilO
MASISPKNILWINRNFRVITIVFAVLFAILGYFVMLRNLVTTVFQDELTTVRTLKGQRAQQETKRTRAKEFLAKYSALSAEERLRLDRILPTKAEIPLLFNQLPAMVRDSGFFLDSLAFTEGADITIGSDGVPRAGNTNSASAPTAANGNVNASPSEGTNTNAGANANGSTNSNASVGSGRPYAVSGKTLRNVSVSLSISGGTTYADLKKFLDVVERNLRVLDIVSINFNTVLPGTTQPGETAPVSGTEVQIPSYSLVLQTYYFNP